MYNPMSLNVIRQACEWGGFQPTRIAQVFSYLLPTGDTVSTVHVHFEHRAIIAKWGGLTSATKDWLQSRLHDCFSYDVLVVAVFYDVGQDEYIALLSCTVHAADDYSETFECGTTWSVLD